MENRKHTVFHIYFRDLGTKFERLRDKLDEFLLRQIDISFWKLSSTSIIDYIKLMTWKSKLPLLDEIEIETTIVENCNLSTNLDDVQPLSTVKCLRMDLPSFDGRRPIINDIFMLYIMKKFPSLTKLFLYQEDNTQDASVVIRNDSIIPFSADVLIQFLHYTSKIDDSLVELITAKKKKKNILIF